MSEELKYICCVCEKDHPLCNMGRISLTTNKHICEFCIESRSNFALRDRRTLVDRVKELLDLIEKSAPMQFGCNGVINENGEDEGWLEGRQTINHARSNLRSIYKKKWDLQNDHLE